MLKINIVKSGASNEEIVKTVTFEARRSLDGDLMILDHDLIDIVVSKDKSKVTTFPKKNDMLETYDVQESLLYHLSKTGIVNRSSIKSSIV